MSLVVCKGGLKMEYKGRLVLPNKRNELSKTPMKSGHLRIQSKKIQMELYKKDF